MAAPGLADAMALTVRRLWRDSPLPVIVDASVLDWLPHGAGGEKCRSRRHAASRRSGAVAAQAPMAQVQANRPQAVREISRRYGNCWVVLKGHQTLVGRSEGEIFVNPSGNPHLAQGGSGDVLAGFIAGLLAQPALQTDVEKTIRYAVWQHGAAADKLQAARTNWVIEDLIGELGNAR